MPPYDVSCKKHWASGLAFEAPLPLVKKNAEYAQDSITEYYKKFFQLLPH